MNKWLTEVAKVVGAKLLPLLAAAALGLLAASDLLERDRAELAQCVLRAPDPRTCVSPSSPNRPVGPLARLFPRS